VGRRAALAAALTGGPALAALPGAAPGTPSALGLPGAPGAVAALTGTALAALLAVRLGGHTRVARWGGRALSGAAPALPALLTAGALLRATPPDGAAPGYGAGWAVAATLGAVLGTALGSGPGRSGPLRRLLAAGTAPVFRRRGPAPALAGAAAALAGGVLAASAVFPAGSWQPPAPGFTDARQAALFRTYAERLGLERSAVALAAPGSLATRSATADGGQRVLDLTGRTDPALAAAWSAHDMAALRRFVLDRARPEFLHLHGAFARRTGLTAARLAAHGYRPLLRRGAGGDYVHRSAVTVPERLPELRVLAHTGGSLLPHPRPGR
ncbi:hypothetical protein HOY81_25705, partial [Streptomyces sp. JJ36]|nr:hypothetical protein [Streptomyces sp. JJ36]